MKVDVYNTEEDVGNVIGDLNRCRGMISGQESSAAGIRIKAEGPLSEMFGYISTLPTLNYTCH
jgi:elongation factor G